MLIPNKTWCSGSPLNVNYGERSQTGFRTETNINKYCYDGAWERSVGIPSGYGFHYAWGKFITNIGFTPNNTRYAYLAMRNGANGYGTINFSNLAGVKRAVCTISGTSYIGVADKVDIIAIAKFVKQLVGLATVNANIAALVNLIPRAIVGTSDVDASLGGISLAVCDIVGTSDVSADIASNALISSNIEGTSTFTSDIIASMYIVAAIVADSILQGDIVADAFMSSDIFMGAEVDPLSPSGLAAAVWNALANDFNDSGTMGQKLNSAAVGGIDYDDLATAVWGAGSRELTAGTKDIEIDTISTIIQTLEKLTGNKVTKSGNIITIYESNGSTVWRQYDLSNGGRVEV